MKIKTKDNNIQSCTATLRFKIPGRTSQKLLSRFKKSVAKTNDLNLYGLIFKKANGTIIEDYDNNKFIDFFGGASVMILGYNDEELTQTFFSATKELQHTCSPYSPNIHQIELSEELIKTHSGNYQKKVILGLSGSDSIDGAIKAAIKYTGKKNIVSFSNSYHGSVGYALKTTDFVKTNSIFKQNNTDIIKLEFPKNIQETEITINKLKEVSDQQEIAAIIFESIQGDAGMILSNNEFFSQMQEICKQKGIVTICDEIQSGIGRTGKFWGFEHFNIIPDIIVTGKGLSNGYAPISAVIGKQEIIDSLTRAQHVFTFTGHPASCAVSKKVIQKTKSLMQSITNKGEYFLQELNKIKNDFSELKIFVRGKGLMIGVELRDKKDNIPLANIIARRCLEKGIYFGYIGKENEVLRIQPSYIITKDQIDKSVKAIRESLNEHFQKQIPMCYYEYINKHTKGLGD